MEGDLIWSHYMKIFKIYPFLSYQVHVTQLEEFWISKSVQIDKIQTFWDEYETKVSCNS